MSGPVNHFGRDVAVRYDDEESVMFDVALPLAAAGVQVHGIELSSAMVAQLRAKEEPSQPPIPVTIGDMTHTRVAGEFGLVYLVVNTIGNLTTQDAQVACFENAAAHLVPGGRFVIEVGVPQLRRLPPGDAHHVFDHTADHVGIDEYDTVTQGLVSHHWAPGVGWASLPFRYVWPAELDLMARIAGMRLRERWADWDRSQFTADSEKHVSVWEAGRPAPPRPGDVAGQSRY